MHNHLCLLALARVSFIKKCNTNRKDRPSFYILGLSDTYKYDHKFLIQTEIRVPTIHVNLDRNISKHSLVQVFVPLFRK
jgi:hypothetical protein